MAHIPDPSPHAQPEVLGWLDPVKRPPRRPRRPTASQAGLPGARLPGLRLSALRLPRLRLPRLPRLTLPRGLWLTLLALPLLLALGLGLQRLLVLLQPPPAPEPVFKVAQLQVRRMLGHVEECRGTESLLVMLPPGAEREVAVGKLLRHQREIDAWLRDNGPWLAAAQGQATVVQLREAAAAWRAVQQRITADEAAAGRNGLARESRVLLIGPSAEAYRRLVSGLERLMNQDLR